MASLTGMFLVDLREAAVGTFAWNVRTGESLLTELLPYERIALTGVSMSVGTTRQSDGQFITPGWWTEVVVLELSDVSFE